MAFKLTKTESKQLVEIIEKLQNATEPLISAMQEYADALENAREFRDGIVERWQSEIDDKSERWQESEAAEAAGELKNTWENMDLEALDFDLENVCTHALVLAEVPTDTS